MGRCEPDNARDQCNNQKKMNRDKNESVTTEHEQNKVGRPSKYEPAIIEWLLSAIADGLNIKQACRASGISEATLSRWKVEHPELLPQLEQAREQCRRDTLARIKKAGQADWRADKAFLELSYQEYRQPNTRVEVKTAAQAGDVQVVYTEEQRRAMIEARERFLNDRADATTHPPNAVTQPKSQPGTPIGRTRVPEDPQIAWMRSLEQAPGNQQQGIVQPGATFTPYWEPAGVSEADLYR